MATRDGRNTGPNKIDPQKIIETLLPEKNLEASTSSHFTDDGSLFKTRIVRVERTELEPGDVAKIIHEGLKGSSMYLVDLICKNVEFADADAAVTKLLALADKAGSAEMTSRIWELADLVRPEIRRSRLDLPSLPDQQK
jgi:hypothetical protein